MTTKLQSLWQKFSSRKYREAFVDAHLSSTVAAQIATMRLDRDMTQQQLADKSGMKQSRICVLENPENTSLTLATLKRVASALDVALIVRFVPYSALASWSAETRGGKFSVPSFSQDRIWRDLAFMRGTNADRSEEIHLDASSGRAGSQSQTQISTASRWWVQ